MSIICKIFLTFFKAKYEIFIYYLIDFLIFRQNGTFQAKRRSIISGFTYLVPQSVRRDKYVPPNIFVTDFRGVVVIYFGVLSILLLQEAYSTLIYLFANLSSFCLQGNLRKFLFLLIYNVTRYI